MNVFIFSQNKWNESLKYQRHHLAEFFAKKESIDNVYFLSKAVMRKLKISDFFNGKVNKIQEKRKKDEKIKIVDFIVFPYQIGFFFLNRFFLFLLKREIKKNYVKSSINIFITYQPFPEFLELVENFKPHKTIYISVHDYENMKGVSPRVRIVEKEIIQKVDLFTTDSFSLFNKLKDDNDIKRNVSLEPACPMSVVIRSKNRKESISKSINKIIYFGTLAKYLDWSLLSYLEEKGVQLDFMGVEYDIKLAQIMSNSILYDPIDFEYAYETFMEYSAIILPYKNNSRNDHIIPAKIYECFSLGLPIFTPLMKWTQNPEIKDCIFVYENKEDLLEKINNFNYNDFVFMREKMLLLAEDNTWDKRFSSLYDFMKGD